MVAALVPSPVEAEVARSARALAEVQNAMTDVVRAVGGRTTTDSSSTVAAFGSLGMWAYLPPPSAEQSWRTLDLDLVSMERLSPHKIAELMADLSPEISGGVNDWLRFCNPGYELVAMNANGRPHPRGQKAADEFRDQLAALHGTFDVVVNRLYLGAYMRGAFFSELVGDQRGRAPVDIATPDPATVRFRRIHDPVRGDVYDLGQLQGGRFVSLSDRETIRYVPVDPFPGSPYGRPMISASIFLGLFLLGLLRDVRRVVAQQGYPRLDVSVDVKRLYESLPQGTITNLDEFSAWSAKFLNQIAQVYQGIKPDSAYVHLDSVTVNHPKGALDNSSLGALDGLTKAIERGLARGLKTSPLILGLTEGTSEAQANRQWEIHAARIKAAQHWCEGSLGAHFTQAVQMQGIDAVIAVQFAELRSAELLRDEQVKQLQLANAVVAYNEGIIGQDEKAMYAWGKDKADQEAPRVTAAGATADVPDASEVVAEPGANRMAYRRAATTLAGSRRARVPAELIMADGTRARAYFVGARIEGSADDLPAVPAKVPVTEADDDPAGEAWDDALPEYAGLLDAEVVE